MSDGPEPLPTSPPGTAPQATRSSLQLGRRLFHAGNGVAASSAYAVLFTHEQVIHIFGTIACLVYILDRIRLHYPEILARAPWINHAFFRAEEQVRESAMIPYAIASLLTLITFPKPIALIAIATLALADPASAIVGITWGRRRLLPNKTLEGSLAFLLVTCAVAATVLHYTTTAPAADVARAAALVGLAAATFELLPLRIDDNLTIPLFVGFASWVICGALGLRW